MNIDSPGVIGATEWRAHSSSDLSYFNRENIKEYASTGVDIISLGFLTHSVQGLDVKLDLELII